MTEVPQPTPEMLTEMRNGFHTILAERVFATGSEFWNNLGTFQKIASLTQAETNLLKNRVAAI